MSFDFVEYTLQFLVFNCTNCDATFSMSFKEFIEKGHNDNRNPMPNCPFCNSSKTVYRDKVREES